MNTKENIIAEDKEHLKNLIEQETLLNGNHRDLNHIDVSNVTDISGMFASSQFNQDISNWDIRNVKTIDKIFGLINNNIPYWVKYNTQEERISAYHNYLLLQKLNLNLPQSNKQEKKLNYKLIKLV